MDRIFLNQMAEDRKLSKYKVVIIDQAHQRNVNTDVIIGFIRECLEIRNDIRFVITSATLDEKLFEEKLKL